MVLRTVRRAVARVGDAVHHLACSVAAVLLGAMMVLLVASMVLREWLGTGLPWAEDVSRWMLMWTVFLGVAVASRGNEHISMEAVYDRLPGRWQRSLSKLHVLACLVLALMLLRLGLQNTERVTRLEQTSRSGDLPAWIGSSALPVGFAFVAVACVTFLLAGKPMRGTKADVEMESPTQRGGV